MGVKEDFLEWSGGEKTLEKWHEYKKHAGMQFNDEFFHNVIVAEEKAEGFRQDLPIDISQDPGFIGSPIDMVDPST